MQHRLFEAERTRDIGKNSLGRGYMHVAQLRKLWKEKNRENFPFESEEKRKEEYNNEINIVRVNFEPFAQEE